MAESFYAVDDVADMLGLHVRTVRRYVREGRLPAVRIGKQYRIAPADLEAFTGRAEQPAAAQWQPRAQVSAIVDVDDCDRATADRITTLVMAVGTVDRGVDDVPLRVETAYDDRRARMKIVILGGLPEVARTLEYIQAVTTS